jgi:activator of HSP90 ATPase
VYHSNRKSKLIFFYEFVIKAKWTGRTVSGEPVTGTISIPNLSEENDASEVDVNVVAIDSESSEGQAVKELMRTRGKELVQTKIEQWIKALREEYALDLIKPAGGAAGKPIGGDADSADATGTAKSAPQSAADSSVAAVADQKAQDLMTVQVEDTFRCSSADLYLALTDAGRIQAYTQSEAKSDPKVGGLFSMFGNNVSGTYIELEENKKIVM